MMLTLYRSDRRGRTRYVTVHNRQGSLFSPYCFTVIEGATVTHGRERLFSYDSAAAMDRAMQSFINERLQRGYRLLYQYFRHQEYPATRRLLETASSA